LEAVIKYKLIILPTTTKSYIIVLKHFGEIKLELLFSEKAQQGGMSPAPPAS